MIKLLLTLAIFTSCSQSAYENYLDTVIKCIYSPDFGQRVCCKEGDPIYKSACETYEKELEKK
jgi:hypothetical protein